MACLNLTDEQIKELNAILDEGCGHKVYTFGPYLATDLGIKFDLFKPIPPLPEMEDVQELPEVDKENIQDR